MKKVNFNEEKKLWAQGFNYVVGLDESGRGPLAGPVVAAAVFVSQKVGRPTPHFLRIRDSKKLPEKKREELYNILTKHRRIAWGIGVVSEKVIDKINIFNATKLAMRKALKNLKERITPGLYYNSHGRENRSISKKLRSIDFLLIDGNFALNSVNIPQKSIIAADEKVFSCVAAGIIAKVTRDNIMKELHEKYPEYGFHKHKGYGTKMHMKNLQNFGPCKIHRKTFFPVSILAKSRFI